MLYVYANGMRNASDDAVRQARIYLRRVPEANERLAIVKSFAYVRNRTLLEENLNRSIADDSSDKVGITRAERNVLFDAVVGRDEFGLALGIRLL